MPAKKEIKWCVDETTGCWNCVSHSAKDDAYPRIVIDKKSWNISRYVYTVHHGPIPHGFVIRHTCDNRLCINPEHLILGTQLDNIKDMIDRGRHYKINGTGKRLTNYSKRRKKKKPNKFGKIHKRLTEEEAKKIKHSTKTPRELSFEFGITVAAVRNVQRGISWTNI